MKSKKVKIIVSLICIVVLIAAASLVSVAKFNTANSIAVAISAAKLYFTDAEYVEIQKSPRIIISEKGDMKGFLEVLEKEGYTHLEDEQMGSLHVVEKNGQKELISSKTNGYYSLWTWQ